jgi:hypothetical protein
MRIYSNAAGCVYFIREADGGRFKIGHSKDPRGRRSALQTGNPRVLQVVATLPGGARAERALHRRFGRLLETGEWFRPSPDLLGFVDGVAFAQGNDFSQQDHLDALTLPAAEVGRPFPLPLDEEPRSGALGPEVSARFARSIVEMLSESNATPVLERKVRR